MMFQFIEWPWGGISGGETAASAKSVLRSSKSNIAHAEGGDRGVPSGYVRVGWDLFFKGKSTYWISTPDLRLNAAQGDRICSPASKIHVGYLRWIIHEQDFEGWGILIWGMKLQQYGAMMGENLNGHQWGMTWLPDNAMAVVIFFGRSSRNSTEKVLCKLKLGGNFENWSIYYMASI